MIRDAVFYTDLNTHRLHGIILSETSTIYDIDLDLGSLFDVLVIDKDQKCRYRMNHKCLYDFNGFFSPYEYEVTIR